MTSPRWAAERGHVSERPRRSTRGARGPPTSMTVIVLLGAPGAGKGTQAALLTERLGIPHVATGDLFRAAVRDGSPIGLEARRYMERGQLVPDEITIGMLLARLEAPDAVDGAILDGFPRNRPQAEALDAALAGARAAGSISPCYIDVPLEELVRRLSGRWICQRCRPRLPRAVQPAARRRAVRPRRLAARSSATDDRAGHDPGPPGRPARQPARRGRPLPRDAASCGRSTAVSRSTPSPPRSWPPGRLPRREA